jgi:hypothetical protein
VDKNVTAFAKRSWSTIDHIEPIDRKHNLKTKVASVPHNNGTAAFSANDESAIANNQQPGRGGRYLAGRENQQGRHRQKRTPIFHVSFPIGRIRA